MSDNKFKPGDVQVEKLFISSKTGGHGFDIRHQALEINIYEDLAKPFVYAEIMMLDALGLIDKIPIIGQEILQIKINTPGLKTSRELMLNTHRVSNLIRSDQSKSATYIIQAISPEMINNSSVYVSKGYKDTINNMVKDIIKTYAQYNSKPIVSEPTKGVQNIVIPKLRPYQAIDFLKKRASSLKNNSSSFVFFENQLGIYFITMEELILDNHIGTNFFNYYGTASDSSKGEDYKSIIEYFADTRYDVLSKISSGGIASNSFRFDLITKTFQPVIKTAAEHFTHLNQQQTNLGDLTQGIGSSMKPDLAKHFIIHDSSQPDTYLAESNALRDVYEGNFGNATTILVHGDANLTAGQKVNIKSKISTGETIPTKPDKVTGNYLIAALRHQIITGNRPRHVVSMALIDDSYAISVK